MNSPPSKVMPINSLVRFCLYSTTPTIDAFIYQPHPQAVTTNIDASLPQDTYRWLSTSADSTIRPFLALFVLPIQKLLYFRSWRLNTKKRAFTTSLPSFHPHKLIHRPNLYYSHFCRFWQSTNICWDKYITICPDS